MHQALQRFYDQAPYVVLYLQDTVEAYRNDQFTGLRAPAGRDRPDDLHAERPVVHADQAGLRRRPGRRRASGNEAAASSDSGGDSSTGLIIAIIAGVVIVVGGGIFIARRRQTADERE